MSVISGINPSINGGSRVMPKFIYISGEIPPDAYGELILSPTFSEAILSNPNAIGEFIQSSTFSEATLTGSNAYGELILSPTFVEGSRP